MVKIERIEVKRKYKYVWLKEVCGVDLTQHCAKCLIGNYVKGIDALTRIADDIVLNDAMYYYLCGVDGYSNNMHVAFCEDFGSVVEVDNDDVYLRVVNASIVPIESKHIDNSLPHSRLARYNTCRNWWFANMIYQEVTNAGKKRFK